MEIHTGQRSIDADRRQNPLQRRTGQANGCVSLVSLLLCDIEAAERSVHGSSDQKRVVVRGKGEISGWSLVSVDGYDQLFQAIIPQRE